MSKKPPKSVQLGFERDCMEISLELLHVEIPLPNTSSRDRETG